MLGRIPVWSFGSILLAMGAFVVAFAMATGCVRLSRMDSRSLLLIAWIVTWFALRLHKQRDLQRQLEELNEIANSGG